MNIRLKKDFAFTTGLIYDGRYVINQYIITAKMTTNCDDHRQQNVAYERIKYWIHEILDSAVLMPEDHELFDAFMATGQRVITLPEQPVDQVIGIMLYCKLNAIAQDRIIITDIEIRSTMGDNMTYLHNVNETVGPFAATGWWYDARPVFNHNTTRARSNKVVTLGRPTEWKDLDLDWEETSEQDSTVVFADFKKNDTE